MAKLDGTAAIGLIHTPVCFRLHVTSSQGLVQFLRAAADRNDIPKAELTFAHTEGQCFSS